MFPLLFALAASAACHVGLTTSAKPIPCIREAAANKPIVAVIGGLDGSDANADLIRKEVASAKGRYSILAVDRKSTRLNSSHT